MMVPRWRLAQRFRACMHITTTRSCANDPVAFRRDAIRDRAFVQPILRANQRDFWLMEYASVFPNQPDFVAKSLFLVTEDCESPVKSSNRNHSIIPSELTSQNVTL